MTCRVSIRLINFSIKCFLVYYFVLNCFLIGRGIISNVSK